MTIAEEKTNPSVFARQLIRLTPARNITPDLDDVGGGSNLHTYSYGESIAFAGLRVKDTTDDTAAVVRVMSYPPPSPTGSTYRYYVDEATGVITINLGTDSSPDQSVFCLVASVYLFFTQGETLYWYADPEDDTKALVEWHPRIEKSATVKQTQKNIVAGLITYDPTSFEILNADSYFQTYLADNDTFFNTPCMIWEYLGDPSTIQRVFGGKVSALSIASRKASLSAFDDFYSLSGTADFNLNQMKDLGPGTSPFPDHASRQKNLIVSGVSYFSTGDFASTNAIPGKYVTDATQSAGCYNYSATLSTSVNRNWTLGLIYGGIPSQTFGTIEAEIDTGVGLLFVRFSSYTNLHVGDTITWVEAATTYYGHIAHVGTFVHSAVTYNVMIGFVSQPFSTSSTMVPNKCIGVGVRNAGVLSNAFLGRDYTLTETAIGDFTLFQITFVNNFETNFAFSVLDPSIHDVYWRSATSGDVSHGNIVQLILESSGLTVNAASITAANAALDNDVSFSVPTRGETRVGKYSAYLEAILSGTFGYLSVGSDQEVRYKLFGGPSSSDTRDDDVVLENQLRVLLDYQDIATRLAFVNPNLPGGSSKKANPVFTDFVSETLNNKAIASEITHALNLDSSDTVTRGSTIMSVLAKRRATYTYATQTLDIEAAIGDDVLIQSNQIPGGAGSRAAKVISVEKSGDSQVIRAIDLAGI